MEQILHHHQTEVSKHKHYLLNKVSELRIGLIAMLMPSFLTGWKLARMGGHPSLKLKRLLKLGFVSAASHVKRQVKPLL